MSKRQRGRGSKYTDAFKKQLVLESRADGVTVPMVANKHGVPTSRIYSWRGDTRFQPTGVVMPAFTPVEVTDGDEQPDVVEHLPPEPRIEITLENGRKLSISDGVDAGFVLELARGLAAQTEQVLEGDPYSGHLFLFRGRRGDQIKMIWWDGQGACLFTKRLEKGRFVWPAAKEGKVKLSRAQLAMLMEGIDWRIIKKTWRPSMVG